jgi:hypothetical protein
MIGDLRVARDRNDATLKRVCIGRRFKRYMQMTGGETALDKRGERK